VSSKGLDPFNQREFLEWKWSRTFCLVCEVALRCEMCTLDFLITFWLHYVHLENFLKYKCELCSKQPLTPPQCKIIVAYRTSNHKLAIGIGWCTSAPISLEIVDYAIFAPTMSLRMRHIFVLECPLYNPTRGKFPSLFENMIPRSLTSFFQSHPLS
jgi:hypothetical protein